MDVAAYRSLRDLQREHWWFVGRRKILRRLINQHLTLRQGAKVLEAGCGYGGNLPLLSEFGELSAFEFDEAARNFASTFSGVDVCPGSLPNGVDLGDSSFDLIAILDVLEHIEDDSASLRLLGRHLSQNGRILVTVPAFGWLWSPHDELHHHKRRYSRKELESCLRDAGLRPIASGYFNTLLFPLAVARRMLSRLKHETPKADSKPSVPVNSILSSIFGYESKWIGKITFPFGLSLYAVAERA